MRVGSTLLLVFCLLVAPATSVLAQPGDDTPETPLNDDGSTVPQVPGGEGGDDGKDVVVVQETDEHIVAVVNLPASAVSPEHDVQYTAPVGSAEMAGSGGDESYTVRLTISPEQFEGGEVALGQQVYDVSAVLEDHPDSPIPAIAEQANDTLDQQLDRLFSQVNQLYGDVESLEREVEQIKSLRDEAEGTAREEPLANSTLNVALSYLDMSTSLLGDAVDDLNRTLDRAPTEEAIKRAEVVHTLFRLAYISFQEANRTLNERDPSGIGLGGFEELDERVDQVVAKANETTSEFFTLWRETLVPTVMAWQGFLFDGTRNATGEGFGAINGALYGDPCDEEDEQDKEECEGGPPLTEQVRMLLLDVLNQTQQNLTSVEREVLDRMEEFQVPPLGEHLPDDVDYESIRKDLANISRNATPGEAYDDWTTDQINKTVDEMRLLTNYLLWVLDVWVDNVDSLEPQAAENTAEMLHGAHAQLNKSWQQLDEAIFASGGGCEEDPDEECPEPPEKNPWEQAWADFNASYEQARNATQNLTTLATNLTVVEDLWDEQIQDLGRPTQIRVMIPRDVQRPDDTPRDIDDRIDPDDPDDLPYYGEPPSPDAATCEVDDSCPDEDLTGDSGDLLGDGEQSDDGSDGGTSDAGSDDSGEDGDGAGEEQDDGDEGDDAGADGDDSGAEGQPDGQDDEQDDAGDGQSSSTSGPDVSVDPGAVSVSQGEQTVTYLQIANGGDSEQTYHLTATSDAPVAVDAPDESTTTLGPGESGEMRARITPTGTGDGAVTFHVAGEDGSTSQEVPVSVAQGASGEPTVEVRVMPWNLRLGEDQRSAIDVSVENVGSATRSITVEPLTNGPIDAEVDGPASAELAPGDEETLSVSVTPDASGPAEVTVRVTTSSGDALSPIALLTVTEEPVPGAEDQGAEDQDANNQEEERGLPLPGAAGLIALGLGALARRTRRD